MDQLANPYAPSLRVLEALSSEGHFRRPAQTVAGGLIERIADREGFAPDWITIGSGIDDLLVALVRGYGRSDNVVLFPPTDTHTQTLVGRLGFKPPLIAGLLILALGMVMLGRLPVGGSFATEVLAASLVVALNADESVRRELEARLNKLESDKLETESEFPPPRHRS
jgi:hypothetical protein